MSSPFTRNQHQPQSNNQGTSMGSGQQQNKQKSLFLFSITVGAIASVCIYPQTAQAQFIQRSFLNPSFEQDLTPYPAKPTSPGITTISSLTNCYIQVDQTSVPGWNTTHGLINGGGNCSGYINPNQSVAPTGANLIELWTIGFSSNSGGAVTPPDGNVFAELNAEQNSQLYQNLCLFNNETIQFSVNHRGRSNANTADVASFIVDSQRVVRFATANDGNPTSTTAFTPTNATNISLNAPGSPLNGWVNHSGSLQHTGASNTIRVGFEAISTATGDIRAGNFIDNTQFAGLPVIEFSASSGGAAEAESNPTSNPPKIRVVGLVPTSGIVVPISIGSGSTATLGVDYNTPTGTNNFTMTIPAGNYDGSDATSTFFIPFTIIQDGTTEGNETIVFEIGSSSNYFISSTTTCGASPIGAATYTVFDDEFLSGRVWNDVDNSANGTFTNIQTGSEVGTNAGGLLNAILVDSNGNVLVTTPVQADGTYTFDDVPFNTDVTIRLSTETGVVGSPAPVASLPSGWVATSPLETISFNSSNSITDKDFGIRGISPQVLLVKRITAIERDGIVTNNIIYRDDDDDVNFPDTTDDNDESWLGYNSVNDSNTFTLGELNISAIPGDRVEYTIYFLNTGFTTASSVKICDPLSQYLTYIPNRYGSSPDQGIELFFGGVPTALTGFTADSDAGGFVAAGVVPTDCVSPDDLLPMEVTDNPNGTVVVDLSTVAPATSAGSPNTSYGYIRFWATVD